MFRYPFEYYDDQHKFLVEIAREVDKLIHEHPSKIDRFRQQVRVFVEKCENYLQSVQSVKQNPPYLLAPVLSEQDRSQLPSPKNIQDLLPDHYFILSLIHDNILSRPRFVPISKGVFSMEADWVKSCWDYYRRRAADNEEKSLIETALERVKADLARIEQTERDAQKGKLGF